MCVSWEEKGNLSEFSGHLGAIPVTGRLGISYFNLPPVSGALALWGHVTVQEKENGLRSIKGSERKVPKSPGGSVTQPFLLSLTERFPIRREHPFKDPFCLWL